MTDHNLDQCLKQLDVEFEAIEERQLIGIKRVASGALRWLIFEGIPIKTGITAASTDLQVNSVSSFKITRTKARMAVGEGNKFVPQMQARLAEAADRLAAVKRIADVHQITIANNSRWIVQLNGGTARRKPPGFFEAAAAKVRAGLDALQSEVS